jgi:hypothetical protein
VGLIWEQEVAGSNPAIPTAQSHFSKLYTIIVAILAGGPTTLNAGRCGLALPVSGSGTPESAFGCEGRVSRRSPAIHSAPELSAFACRRRGR